MNVRAVFIDMDGTLLDRTNTISKRNAEAIYMLINQGVKVFLATGRQYEITIPYHQQLGLHTPMICLNGATIHDRLTGKAIQIKPVTIDEKRFHEMTADDPCNIIIHAADGLYCKRTSPEVNGWVLEGKIPPRHIGDLRKVNYGAVLKYSIRTGYPNSPLASLFKEEADIIHWNDGFEMMAKGISKWSAIETILRAYRISEKEVVAIGDGPNDLTMLSNAGFGVAMGNASAEVKASADYVTSDVQEDGLAEFIERFLIHSPIIPTDSLV